MMIVYFIYVTPQDIILRLDSTSLPINNDLICMTIQAHTVLQKLFLGIKIIYNTGQLRYFDNNLSRTSKQAEMYFMN